MITIHTGGSGCAARLFPAPDVVSQPRPGKDLHVDVMRFTIVDERGTVSFVTHSSAVLALLAACSHDPHSLEQLLDAVHHYDRSVRSYVLNGLAVFDEHNVPGDARTIHQQLASLPAPETPVFRVVDELTREQSLQSVKAGIVLFNLPKKRIIQIQNSYELPRSGTVNFHNGRFLSRHMLSYELPPSWSIVP